MKVLIADEGYRVMYFFNNKKRTMKNEKEFAIVVVDKGFVYVGEVVETDTHVFMTAAKNIRCWGTKSGLGELVMGGPTPLTELDACGNLRVPIKCVISIHETKESLWK